MALTSVVPAFPAQQATELPNGTIGVQAFSNFQTINIPQSNQMNLVNSPEVSSNLILPSVTPPPPPPPPPPAPAHPPYFQSASLPNAYFANTTSGPDPFRFIHPALHAIFNPYSSFRTSPYSAPLVNGHTPRACLLPTPGPTVQSSSSEGVAQTENGIMVRGIGEETQPCESGTMSEDQMSVKQFGSNPDTGFPHQNSIILIVRLLMSGKEVGSIIGKGGENVKKYREESGARINISDGSSPERIVTVTGTTNQIFVAFSLMSQKFEDDFTQGLLRMGDEGLTCPPVTLRLLVPATQCGSIIGKGGSRIKDVRELTGASIQVASEALPTSTERTVTISGTAKAIAKCIRQLCDIFIESPAKGPVIPYRPKPAFVNHPAMCTNGPYPAGVMQQMAFHGLPNESAPEHMYANCTSTHGVVLNSPVQIAKEPTASITSSVGQPVIGPLGINQGKFLTMDGNFTGAFNASSDPSNSTTGITTTRTNFVNDLLTDAAQIPNALSYSEFPNNSFALLSAIHSNQLAANGLQNSVLHTIAPNFTFPELAVSPRLLGFYNSPAISVTQHSGTESGDESLDSRLAIPDLYTNNPILSLLHSNAYLQSNGMLTSLSASPVPIMQNKSSILGLPAFPFQSAALTDANNLPEDVNVMKEIVLSNDLIGCIIGRGGTTVNEIRNISKAQVKISNCEDGAKDRKITLSGTPQAVNLAHFLINNRISAELFAGMIKFVNQ